MDFLQALIPVKMVVPFFLEDFFLSQSLVVVPFFFEDSFLSLSSVVVHFFRLVLALDDQKALVLPIFSLYFLISQVLAQVALL